jgi:hypothetical protein
MVALMVEHLVFSTVEYLVDPSVVVMAGYLVAKKAVYSVA